MIIINNYHRPPMKIKNESIILVGIKLGRALQAFFLMLLINVERDSQKQCNKSTWSHISSWFHYTTYHKSLELERRWIIKKKKTHCFPINMPHSVDEFKLFDLCTAMKSNQTDFYAWLGVKVLKACEYMYDMTDNKYSLLLL
jgi:hypothetical protein